MTDPAHEEERRELERRAFARDGSGLSPAEAARLSELRRPASPVPDRASLPLSSDRAPVPEAPRDDEPSVPERAPLPPGPERAPRAAGSRFRARFAAGRGKRPRVLVGGAAALLLAGLLIGWAIPRPPDVGLALRAGEAERRDATLKEIDHDPGSVVLLDRSDDALLWTWTNMSGRLRCAVLDVPRVKSEPQCQVPDELANGPYTLQVSASLPPAADRSGVQVVYGSTLFLAGQGFPGGRIQRWESDSRMMHQGMSDDEVAAAARLATDQKLEGLSIVGRWRGLPVWRGFADHGTSQCLIVETPDPQRGCASDGRTYSSSSSGGITILGSENAEESSVVLEVPATDDRPSASIELRTGNYIGSYLMITENAAIGDRSLLPRA